LRRDRRHNGCGRNGARDDDGVTAVLLDADLEALVLELELARSCSRTMARISLISSKSIV
jgi:hypothetical protein